MKRWANRRDANEPVLVNAARIIGFKVFYTSELGDLVVQFGDRTELWEVKTPSGKLTVAQCKLRQAGLKAWTIRTVEEVIAAKQRFL